jgi:hypothetical protein
MNMQAKALTPDGEKMLRLLAQSEAEEAGRMRHVRDLEDVPLKKETIGEILRLRNQTSVLALASHWALGWPKRLKALEEKNLPLLLKTLKSEGAQWEKARRYELENPWVGGIESRQLFGIDPERPPPKP